MAEQHGIHGLRVDRTERGLGNDWYGLAPGADTAGSAEEIREQRAQVPPAVQDSAARAMLLDPRDTGTAEWLRAAARTPVARRPPVPGDDGHAESVLPVAGPRSIGSRAMLPKGTRVARKTGTGGTWSGVTVAINDVGVMRMPNGEEVAIAVLIGEPTGRSAAPRG